MGKTKSSPSKKTVLTASTQETTQSIHMLVQKFKGVAYELGRIPRSDEFYATSNIPEWQVRKVFGGYSKMVEASGLEHQPPAKGSAAELRMLIAKMQTQLKHQAEQKKDLEHQALSGHTIREIIGGIDTDEWAKRADWTRGAKTDRRTHGIPVMMLSDIHADEVVRPEEIGFVNEYSRAVCERRLKHSFQSAVALLKHHMVKPKYEGFVLNLGGDMVSGTIHDELSETNEACINETIIFLVDVLANGIKLLADEFGKVFVPCVVGNHGRHHKKPRAKYQVIDNHEWLVYQFLAREFKNDSRVTFHIPENPDAQYPVYKKSILLTHGNQFKGGAGISGIFTPLALGTARKQKRQQAVGNPFDLMMFGHFHQMLWSENFIGNGSVKGYDEYAHSCNFGFERAQQVLFLMHKDYGMTFRMPIICDDVDSTRNFAERYPREHVGLLPLK